MNAGYFAVYSSCPGTAVRGGVRCPRVVFVAGEVTTKDLDGLVWSRNLFQLVGSQLSIVPDGTYSSEVLLHATKGCAGLGCVASDLLLLATGQGYCLDLS